MPERMTILWFLGSAALLASLGSVLILWKRRLAQTAAVKEVERQFTGIPILAIDGEAFFRGLDRSWDSQWRGSGVLLLTQEMLYFRPWERRLDLSIPIARIEKVAVRVLSEAEESGRGRDRRVFEVCYRGNDDQMRVATWRLRRPRRWADMMHPLV